MNNRVLISVLNWNKAEQTLDCIASLKKMHAEDIDVDILVIDNGSRQEDYAILQRDIDTTRVKLLRVEKNLGFTGGHNLSIRMAIDNDYDFIWLLNNDATVDPDTLKKLFDGIANDPSCGAVSPVIYAEDGSGHHNAWGVEHDWRNRRNCWLESKEVSMRLHETDPMKICLAGTAIMFRVKALAGIGPLDDRLFAYFDDNDVGVRLAHDGWRSKIIFDAVATHGARRLVDQGLHYFYLMARNEMIFWHTHMPREFRRLLWLKLLDQGMFDVNRLYRKGMRQQADSALLGVWDFVRGRHGAPDLARQPGYAARLVCWLFGCVQQKHLARMEPLAVSAS